MTCDAQPHQNDYRALTATGELTAFLHRHNRLLILAAALAVVVAVAGAFIL